MKRVDLAAGIVIASTIGMVGCGTVNRTNSSPSALSGSSAALAVRELVNKATTMPKPRLWTTAVGDSGSGVKANDDSVRLSTTDITKQAISVYDTASGVRRKVYTLNGGQYKQIQGWQRDGRYLALRIGFPPNPNPTTGDYEYRDVVIDLKSNHVVLNQRSSIQSTDYLTHPCFVQSLVTTVHGTPAALVTVINLMTRQQISFELPQKTLGKGIVAGGKLYYAVANGLQPEVVTFKLPLSGWKPLGDATSHPIQL